MMGRGGGARRSSAVCPLLACAILFPVAGCLRPVELPRLPLQPPAPENTPMTANVDGSVTFYAKPQLTGAMQTLAYDWAFWTFARLPCVRASDTGRLVMLDTGMAGWCRVTWDVAAAEHIPAVTTDAGTLGYVPRLRLGRVEARSVPAEVWPHGYDVNLLGLPVYRARGWTLGTAMLRPAHYLMFDNPRQRVTIGREPFQPDDALHWASYPLVRGETDGDARPYVELPVAGQTLRLLLDSAGGPKLIRDAEQWAALAPHVRVTRTARDRYPAWGGFQEVDAYRVASLQVGPVTLRDMTVWVRRGKLREAGALLGLGPLRDGVVVFDYHARLLRLGTRRSRARGGAGPAG